MTTPDFMPVLSKGAHDSPADGACFMEMASYLAGEQWSDSPQCAMPLLAAAARNVNDRVDDATRRSLAVHIPRVIGTATDDVVLQVRLAVWCARYVLPQVREQDRDVCLRAIETAEAWADGRATKQAADAAGDAAYAAGDAANAATAAAAADAAAFLSGLLDEYDRLTGRTTTHLTDTDAQRLHALV